jgi:D-alanyl-D-alanine carboxypeptidase (penicillin-binding protein 5/6)
MLKKLKVVFVTVLAMLLIVTIVAPAVISSFAQDLGLAQENLAKNAKAATLIDFDTGTVVFEKHATDRRPIASMVKIMTLLLVFEKIDAGDLSIYTDVVVTDNAASMGGSQAFLDANTKYKAGELIKSIVVASANDACVALAEHIAGSVEGFVAMMNKRAIELGIKDTNFENCTGLPSSNGYSCAKDVAVMTRELLKHRLFFNYSTVWMFDFAHNSGRTTTLTNTNKLIKGYSGCDGGKTGFTKEAMYCLSVTAKRVATRFIAVVLGVKDSKLRNFEVSTMLNYGFGNFETRQYVYKDQAIKELPVKRGKVETVPIAPADDYYYFSTKTKKQNIGHQVTLDDISAPIQKGQRVGKLTLKLDEKPLAEINLVATSSIDELGFLDILNRIFRAW